MSLALHKLPEGIRGVGVQSLTDWPRRGEFRRPSASVDAVREDSRRNPVNLRDLGPRSTVWRTSNDAAVSRLRLGVGPDAVLWAIAAVIIDPLDGQVVRVASGLGPFGECGKLLPLGVDRNSASAVVDVTRVAGIATPGAHVLPDAVQAGSCRAVRSAEVAEAVQIRATAVRGFPAAKVRSRNDTGAAAVASARPKRAASWAVPGLLLHGPKAKAQSCHVNQSGVLRHGRSVSRSGPENQNGTPT